MINIPIYAIKSRASTYNIFHFKGYFIDAYS